MDRELKIKIISAGVCGVLIFVCLGLAIYLREASVFLVPSAFLLLLLVILEVYLRIQHNIDKKANAFDSVNVNEAQIQKVLQAQNQFMDELDKTKKIYEDILDLLEILIDHLEEMKEKESRQEKALHE